MKIIELISNTLLVDKFRLEGELEETLNHPNITHTERLDMSIKTLKELNEVVQTINLWESLQKINKDLKQNKDGNIK
tara:strand:+ start:11655 stop:11885 length:231 start_codon:yes stop_codon:yes gene_type:complete